MSLAILDDLERGFAVRQHHKSSYFTGDAERARARRVLREIEEERERDVFAEIAGEKERRRMDIVKNFAIVKQSTGKRQQYALYRLWRYLDMDKFMIAEFVKQTLPESPYKNERVLSDLFADIFAEQCEKAKRCVLKPFIPKMRKHVCELEGCGKAITKWNGSEKRFNRFCTQDHAIQYFRTHPEEMVWERNVRYWKRVSGRILAKLRSGKVKYQSQLYPRRNYQGSRDNISHFCRRLEQEGRLKRERAKFDGRWTYRLKVVEKS